MILKTLDQLRLYPYSNITMKNCPVDRAVETIKEEAIKHIKHNKNFERPCGFINDNELKLLNNWIKFFFNISEEDLK